MADASKLKRGNRLGPPPAPEEASRNIEQPEVSSASMLSPAPVPSPDEYQRRDGRSMRRTNRTLQFATRVSPDFDQRLRAVAERDGLLLVEVLERALDSYEATRKSLSSS